MDQSHVGRGRLAAIPALLPRVCASGRPALRAGRLDGSELELNFWAQRRIGFGPGGFVGRPSSCMPVKPRVSENHSYRLLHPPQS